MRSYFRKYTQEDRQKFFDAYVACALWAGLDPDTETPLDEKYEVKDFSEEALKRMREDCTEFFNRARADLILQGESDINGHDFWLTRNGHGTGFWDRGTGNIGARLTSAAKHFGTCDVYPGDDGKLYIQ